MLIHAHKKKNKNRNTKLKHEESLSNQNTYKILNKLNIKFREKKKTTYFIFFRNKVIDRFFSV
jgi:hypothetical protein